MTSPLSSLSLLAALVVCSGAGCAVPHSSRVAKGAYAAVQAGGGAAQVRKGCRDCTVTAQVSGAPSAQVTAGYGWRDRAHPVLAYLTAPLITPVSIGRNAPDDGAEAAMHVAVSLVGGASLGGYVELGGDGETSATGVGAMLNVASAIGAVGETLDGDAGVGYPAAQLYAMTGLRLGGAWLDVGLRGGVLGGAAVGGGGFAAARWRVGGGARVGVWFDAAAASEHDVGYEDDVMYIDRVATAGVMIESW